MVQSLAHLQGPLKRVRAAEHAPRGPFRVLERRHGLAEIVERGGRVVSVERRPRKSNLILSTSSSFSPRSASRHGHRFAQQCLGFLKAI